LLCRVREVRCVRDACEESGAGIFKFGALKHPQGLKPLQPAWLSARLKPCPDENRRKAKADPSLRFGMTNSLLFVCCPNG
jgi:hypothetical protein